MGTRYRQLYMESVVSGRPSFWVAPPANVLASDYFETLIHSVLAFGGTWVLASGIQVAVFKSDIDAGLSSAWGGIIAGLVMLSPVAGDVAADFLSDVRQGWERGAAPTIVESEPVAQVAQAEPTEDEEGAARIEGEWWYKTSSGRLCCYATPRDKNRCVLVSDARMRAVFGLAMTGTPFSEREITERVSGLSGPRFRILKRDWRARSLYVMHDDRSGHFTATGRLIASVIADIDPPAPVEKVG